VARSPSPAGCRGHGLLDDAIFERMKGNNHKPPAGGE
jgi:hypothetical protein